MKAYEAAQTFAVNPEGWLVLIGPTGSGKTHLACAIANHCLNLGQSVFYMGAADLLDHLRATFNADTDMLYDDLFDRVKNVPLLVLDDLTMAVTTPWAKGRLEQLLNYRFNSRLPMVITSDVPIEEIENDMRAHLADEEFCHIFVLQENVSTPLDRIGSLDLELLKNMSFTNFNHKRLNLSLEKRQNLEQALRIAENFAESPQGWLVFQGVNGCGKTHLSAAIANKLRQDGKTALFIVVTDLLDHLRSAFGPDSSVSYDNLFEKIKRAEVLILDDFGEQSSTPWAQEKMYQLINYRYNARLATVITTCQSLDEIESRISSRLVDPSLSLVFNIMAPDYRGDIKVSRMVKKPRRTYD
jgi:DNA replication protein DnaC